MWLFKLYAEINTENQPSGDERKILKANKTFLGRSGKGWWIMMKCRIELRSQGSERGWGLRSGDFSPHSLIDTDN